MSSWRGKLWLKAVALAVAGIFAFSEVTWAARTDFILPPAVTANRNIPSSQENQTPVKKVYLIHLMKYILISLLFSFLLPTPK